MAGKTKLIFGEWVLTRFACYSQNNRKQRCYLMDNENKFKVSISSMSDYELPDVTVRFDDCKTEYIFTGTYKGSRAVSSKLLAKCENRISELDRLFKSIYEDKAKGFLNENRFQMLADDYETEQQELKLKITQLPAEISDTEEQSDNLERFISKTHKYLDLQELTPSILNDMIKRVYVHAPQIIDRKRTQQIDICYDLVGILPMSLLKQNSETA